MFSMPATSPGRRFIFRPHTGRQMATAQGIRPQSAFDQALHQFGARLFEAAPGLVTWILLLAPAWIPIIFPWPGAFVVAAGVLLFDIYWLLRSMTVITGVYSKPCPMRRDMRRDLLAPCFPDPAGGPHHSLQDNQPCLIPTYNQA